MGNAFSNPLLFQGNLQKKNYFEGWYYKQVTADAKKVVSFIPGVSLHEGDCHSFVQYLFTQENRAGIPETKTGYLRFPLEEFIWNDQPFAVKINKQFFSESFLSVYLRDGENQIEGKLSLGDFTPIERNFYMPSIMGPFAYVPRMECYHGVISMSHSLQGSLWINEEEIDFSGGKGYIEKDWGSNFPRDYIWLQSNHFADPTVSFFFSDAHIPFYGKEFQGYICNFSWKGRQYRFATYTNSKLQLDASNPNRITVHLEDTRAELRIVAEHKSQQGKLVAPVATGMEKIIKEGVSGEIFLSFLDKKTGEKIQDKGRMAGIEIVE